MTSTRPALTRRALLTAAGTTAALSACGSGSGAVGPDTPLRIAAVNHVWSQAITQRLAEFEELVGRRVSMQMLTADQLGR